MRKVGSRSIGPVCRFYSISPSHATLPAFPHSLLLSPKLSRRAQVLSFRKNYHNLITSERNFGSGKRLPPATTVTQLLGNVGLEQQQQHKQQQQLWVSTTATNFKEDDYFALLGLPQQFAVDERKMKVSYRNLMAQYHPDKQQQKQKQQEDTASLITAAYDTLKRPHTRASYLLKLRGHPLEEEGVVGAVKSVRPEVLAQVMEVREEIERCGGDDDDEYRAETLRRLWEENQQRFQTTSQDLSKYLDSSEPTEVDENVIDYAKAQQLTAELQYWNRISETIRDLLTTSLEE